jgi:hypothetical protein
MSATPTAERALTVWQPWATLAVTPDAKDVENRTWVPPGWAVGTRLVVHAARRFDPAAAAWVADTFGHDSSEADVAVRSAETLGVFVGTVALVRVHHADECADAPCSRWALPGHYHWTLAHPKPLETPVPAMGRQGLWRLSGDQSAAVAAEVVPR